MLTQAECDLIEQQMQRTMVAAMGIRPLASDDDVARCEMPITDATRQYFGILHGGAYLALAETIAGMGSLHVIGFDPAAKVCGTHVEGIHMAMSPTEGKVFGLATLLHAGRSTHVWNVDVVDEAGRVLSTERVTNRILWDKNAPKH